MEKCSSLIVCDECDAVYQKVPLHRGEVIYCARCGAQLGNERRNQVRTMLPITIASLILFAIANAFPIVKIAMQGMSSEATLLQAVAALYEEGQPLVSLLVFMTTFFFPLSQLLILFYILLMQTFSKQGLYARQLIKLMQIVKPWGMIEVFLLGILVALVKLSNMVTVIPEIAIWAFSGLTILLVIVVSFNLQSLWDRFSTEE